MMSDTTQTAYLAGGCFRGMKDLVRRIPGVLETEVGYSGGDVPRAQGTGDKLFETNISTGVGSPKSLSCQASLPMAHL